MISGSCLCGAVAYEVDGELSAIAHCHCATCRKAHGAAFSSVANTPKAGSRWMRGDDIRRSYESSPGKHRHFCSQCGSQLIAIRDEADHALVRLGSVDGDPGTRPVVHIYRGDGACWYDPAQSLPELPEGFLSK